MRSTLPPRPETRLLARRVRHTRGHLDALDRQHLVVIERGVVHVQVIAELIEATDPIVPVRSDARDELRHDRIDVIVGARDIEGTLGPAEGRFEQHRGALPDQPGNEVVSALIDTLMHDANVNVRLASIDALKRFAEREVVRSAAVRALDTQESPLVQMALIDFVVETQDREALEALRRLSRDDEANEAVRARASWGINHLEAA